MPKKQKKPRQQKAITIRLPPVLAKKLEDGIKAAVQRFEKGLETIKPTLNQLVVDAIDKKLTEMRKEMRK